jgi:ferritin-like protein
VVEKSSLKTDENSLANLTLHNFSTTLLTEFNLKIAKPYFKGNIDEALKTLMEKALTEESLFKKALNK